MCERVQARLKQGLEVLVDDKLYWAAPEWALGAAGSVAVDRGT